MTQSGPNFSLNAHIWLSSQVNVFQLFGEFSIRGNQNVNKNLVVQFINAFFNCLNTRVSPVRSQKFLIDFKRESLVEPFLVELFVVFLAAKFTEDINHVLFFLGSNGFVELDKEFLLLIFVNTSIAQHFFENVEVESFDVWISFVVELNVELALQVLQDSCVKLVAIFHPQDEIVNAHIETSEVEIHLLSEGSQSL